MDPLLPVLVSDAAAMEALVRELTGAPVVAVDTESNSFHVYTERVCLLQISIRGRDWVVDPLAVDVRPLGPLLADGRETVFHGADYDVRCLRREFGWGFPNLFDTVPAAKALGRPALGYSALVEAHFGVRLSKAFQRSDWGHRPLTSEQLRYAAADTHYLLPLRDLLVSELGVPHLDRVKDECRRIAAGMPKPRIFDPGAWKKLKLARGLDAPAQAALAQLWVAREERARALDKPPFKVIAEQTLIELAKRRPASRAELATVPGMTEHVVRKSGDAILEALRRAAAG